VKHAYTILAARGRETKRLPCASAWVAVERRNLQIRQGWKAAIFERLGNEMQDSLLDALAHAEVRAAVKGTEAD
jgi:hypothetical protein